MQVFNGISYIVFSYFRHYTQISTYFLIEGTIEHGMGAFVLRT